MRRAPRYHDANGIIQRITARNNGAEDCPVVTGTLYRDSPENFKTHSGPHLMAFDHETRRVAASTPEDRESQLGPLPDVVRWQCARGGMP